MSNTTDKYMVLNSVTVSGTIVREPELRHVGDHKFAILAIVGETVEHVGKEKNPQVVRWRAKAFGSTAEEAAKLIQKGTVVHIQGRLSGYRKPTRDANDDDVQKLPELGINQIAILPPPVIVVRNDLAEGGIVEEGATDF